LQEAFDPPGLVERLQHNLGLVQDMFKWHDSLDQGAGAFLISMLRKIGAAAAQPQLTTSHPPFPTPHSPTFMLTPQDMFKWHDSLDQGAGAVLMSRLRKIGAAAAAAQSEQLEEQIVLPLATNRTGSKGSKERR
ncbi:unnamed protein product, partial [Closterium sp. Naga37s-1]